MNNILKLTDGFIDLKINENLPSFRSNHAKEYSIIKETKKLLDIAQQIFVGQTVLERELYLSTALVDLNKLFQSAIILFERGLFESGNIIIRSCLELSLKIVELIKNRTFISDMKKELAFETKSTLNIINNKKLYNLIPKETVENLLFSLDLKGPKFKVVVSQLAEKNGLLEEYIIYRLYSNDCHQSISTLSEIQIFEVDGVRLNGNLRLEEFSKAIYMLISVVIIPFPTLIENFCNDNLKKQYDSFEKKFKYIFEK